MLIFDGHCDTLSKINRPGELIRNGFHWDLERAGRYGSFVQVLSSFADHGQRKDPAAVMARQLEMAIAFEGEHPDRLKLIRSASDLKTVQNGGVFGILGAEGAELFKGSIGELERWFNKSLKVVTLCWNYDNEVCDSVAGHRTHRGLSPFGRELVDRMQELGMVIDLSHASDETFEDVLECVNVPVAATHSNCRAICSHPRNLTDAQILKIAATGGVIGINFYSCFLSGSGKAGIKDIINHIEHIAGLTGTRHIGLGCDFDGANPMPEGITGAESLYMVLEALARANYADRDIRMIAGGNFLRLFTRILS
ncbi:MAG TPA: dipeptidase [Thermoclostridium sp.]|nr:M19 family membrane dipeptidase [Clostridiaceae bacterium]HOQ76580.1 dipeptidase [Thermoclostridium sp.]HPU45953.1 dipeptidase [Thermoclostridium sp.]